MAGPVDMPALIAGKQSLIESLRAEKYVDIAASHGWTIRQGAASFAGSPGAPTLQITAPDGTTEVIEAAHYLIATGAQPWIPPIEGLDTVDHLTSTTAMELDEVPKSLLVLGGGYVALEQAELFARLGTEVTMLVRSRLTSREEPEASQALLHVFADEGIRVVRRALVASLQRDARTGDVVATASVSGGEQKFRAEKLLVAVGRTRRRQDRDRASVVIRVIDLAVPGSQLHASPGRTRSGA